MRETCPKCGSNRAGERMTSPGYIADYWECGSKVINGDFKATSDCCILELQRKVLDVTAKLAAAEQRETTAINSAKEIATTSYTEGVWWAKCKNGGVYGPQATEREVLLEVAEMRHVVAEHAQRLAEQRAEGLEELAYNVKEFFAPQEWKYHQPSYKPGLDAKMFDLGLAADKAFGDGWREVHERCVAALVAAKVVEGGGDEETANALPLIVEDL